MSWFGEEGLEKAAVEAALKLAGRQALPVSARSLTRGELLDKHRSVIGLASLGLLVFFLFALFLVAGEGRALASAVTMIALVAAAAMFVAGRARMGRHAGYRDPRIRIEARDDGVEYSGPDGVRRIGWSEIEAKVNYAVGENRHVMFTGLTLASPFGPITLEDGWYANGQALAAEIVQGKMRAEAARERAKAGIKPDG